MVFTCPDLNFNLVRYRDTFVIAVLIMLFVVSGTKGGVHLPGPEFQSCSLQRTPWL